MSWRTQWTDDHGEDGLRADKFTVIQNSTGETITGTGELVFVLRPDSDQSAWYALEHYAKMVWRRSPLLSSQLLTRLDAIRRRNVKARIDARDHDVTP